jgi:hypothetical protein
VNLRFCRDPDTGQPHIHGHAVIEQEVEAVLNRPIEDRSGNEGSRVALGQTASGRYRRVIYIPDPEPDSVFVITAYDLGPKGEARTPAAPNEEGMMKRADKYPPGWDGPRVRRVLEHYETQTDEEAVAEDEAAFEDVDTAMTVPVDLVPAIRKLIGEHRRSA